MIKRRFKFFPSYTVWGCPDSFIFIRWSWGKQFVGIFHTKFIRMIFFFPYSLSCSCSRAIIYLYVVFIIRDGKARAGSNVWRIAKSRFDLFFEKAIFFFCCCYFASDHFERSSVVSVKRARFIRLSDARERGAREPVLSPVPFKDNCVHARGF